MVNQFLDLGGNVCIDLIKSAVTLNQRMQRAIEKIMILKWTKISRKIKTINNKNKHLPSGLIWERNSES